MSGRWMTPDPAGMAAADPANPQSWNRYAYVMNNPLNAIDPFGLQTASENDQCSPNSGTPIGDGNQRQPGKECGTNAIDGSAPHPPKVVTPPMHVYADALDPIQTIYADIGVFVSLVNGTWHPHSTTPNVAANNSPQKPKSRARQQCEQKAQQQFQRAKSAAATNAFTAAKYTFAITEGINAAAGCAMGAGAGAAFGTTVAEFTGGTSSFGGAAVGCFTGGVDMALNGLAPAAFWGSVGGTISYAVHRNAANNDYNQAVQACSQIP